MARPIFSKYFTDRDGTVHRRQTCCVEGCKHICKLFPKYHPNGDKYYWQLKTCNKHRLDGSTFFCNSRSKRKEQIWRAQGIEMDFETYQKILVAQDHRCILCDSPEEEEGRALSVDHCHKTGKVRGIICRRCNVMIGWLEKNMTLDALKTYLEGDIMSQHGDILSDIESP